jgi:hypothetical protein
MPAIVVLPAQRATRVVHSLFTSPMECTRDVFGKGTVLWDLGTSYQETIALEVWTQDALQRRAVLRGLRIGFSPLEGVPSLKLRIPGYYDRVATFTMLGEQRDDSDAPEDRRKVQVDVDLRLPEVRLANYASFRPRTRVDVSDADE